MAMFTKAEANAKTAKSEKAGKGYSTMILHLAPAKESGREVCASRSAGCTAACLYTAGRGRMDAIKQARIRRTKMWFNDRENFKFEIRKELDTFVGSCSRKGVHPAIRMNGTSDIMWEKQWPELFTEYPTIQFYDYTKHVKRAMKSYKLPSNYHLTFSRSESNDKDVNRVLRSGKCNVAVVFDSPNYPPTWRGKPVYSMDETDLRFLDPDGGHVGALYAKGDGKKDETGFVLPVV